MMRRLLLFLIIAPIAASVSFPLFSGPGSASSDLRLAQGDFWRLPWRAGSTPVPHRVGGGYGYGEPGSTHAGGSDNWGEVKKLVASDAEEGDRFGWSVAVSGDIAVVGAHAEGAGGDEAGAAYVFSRNQGGTDNWGEVEKFTASDTEAGDFFGFSVAVSGEVAVVGAVAEDAGGLNAGAAYVFQSMSVGGIAEYPSLEAEPVDESAHGSSLAYAGLAGAGVSGAVLLMAGAWYARRRWRAD